MRVLTALPMFTYLTTTELPKGVLTIIPHKKKKIEVKWNAQFTYK